VTRERTFYRRLRAGPQSFTPTTDRRKKEAAGTSCSESRAKPDMSAVRLKTLEKIIDERDWEKLREWRLSQMLTLGMPFQE
jgi:hypothetical protein